MQQHRDTISMLFSTDWFFSHWSRVGVNVSGPPACALKEGFRDIVGQIVSGAEQYWLASFSAERLEQTLVRIGKLVEHVGVQEPTARRIRDLAVGRPAALIDDTTAWLLTSITQMLIDDSDGMSVAKLTQPSREILLSAFRRSQTNDSDFETESLRSTSPWDVYIRHLTPDLPTYLPDYVSVCILKQSEFERYWNLVRIAATAEQVREIIDWYRSVGVALTGQQIDLPVGLLR